jgi:nucleotide-binding universal stress UspA family protein
MLSNPMLSHTPEKAHTVVGWAGSARGGAALEWAKRREIPRAGAITLLSVVEGHPPPHHHPVPGYIVEAADRTARAEVARLGRAHPELRVSATVRVGDPLDVLVRASNPREVLAVGTSARSGPHFVYGWSMGARLAARSHGPVAVIPSTPLAGPHSGVVVGVDGSPTSLGAALFAAGEAERTHSELLLLSAWAEPVMWADNYEVEADLGGLFEQDSKTVLDSVGSRVRAAFPTLRTHEHVVHGAVAPTLLERSRHSALLVVGTRALRGVTRLVLGSVSHSLILGLEIPTVIVGQAAAEHLTIRYRRTLSSRH